MSETLQRLTAFPYIACMRRARRKAVVQEMLRQAHVRGRLLVKRHAALLHVPG